MTLPSNVSERSVNALGYWAIKLDAIERWLLVLFLVQMVIRLSWNYYANGDISALITIPGETIVVIFVLIRRPALQISKRSGDWFVAITASVLPTLVVPDANSTRFLWQAAGAFLAVSGLIIQLHAKLILGRSFGMVAANRGIRLSGPYRFVRHPMYAGYLIGHVSFLGLFPTLWNAGLLVTAAIFQLNRITREERVLSQDPNYVDYMHRVKFRLLPGLY